MKMPYVTMLHFQQTNADENMTPLEEVMKMMSTLMKTSIFFDLTKYEVIQFTLLRSLDCEFLKVSVWAEL